MNSRQPKSKERPDSDTGLCRLGRLVMGRLTSSSALAPEGSLFELGALAGEFNVELLENLVAVTSDGLKVHDAGSGTNCYA
jgi:hypothetical protein